MKPRSPPCSINALFSSSGRSWPFLSKLDDSFFLCWLPRVFVCSPSHQLSTGGQVGTSSHQRLGFDIWQKMEEGRIFYICQKWKRFLLIFNGIPLREDANTTLRRLKLLFVSFDCHPSGMLPPVREWQQDSCCRQWMHLIARLMLSKIPNEMFQWKHFKG